MKKLALWGLWHVHAGHLATLAQKYSELIGVWDENREKLEEFCEKYDLYAFSSLEEMLFSEAEGIIVCTATSNHKETIITLANAGKHIFTEKVLAITDEDCNEIEKAVKENSVKFAICLPNVFYSGTRTIKEIVDSGEIGKVNCIRFKYSHTATSDDTMTDHFYSKAECGGGALIDHGAHGIHMIYFFKGIPTEFKSILTIATENEGAERKNKDRVEDSSVSVMSYPDGCIAINESSSVTHGPMTLEVNGEKGMLLWTCDKVIKRSPKTNDEFTEIEQIPGMPHPLKQFVMEDIDPACGIEAAKAVSFMINRLYENQDRLSR